MHVSSFDFKNFIHLKVTDLGSICYSSLFLNNYAVSLMRSMKKT